ncbi:MAG: FAD-binding oxidoreductase [Candidatus Kerfeldbacteria bacterium]|nr:FAD-binding oxidoreductase [Candidatus Kerfeldbacteria bacterium]
MAIAKTAVVIGAGIVGVLTTWRLLQDGWHVIQLEATTLGSGSSSRSAACARQQFSTAASVRAMIHSVRWFERFQQCFGAAGPAMRQVGYFYPYWERDATAFTAARQLVCDQQAWGLRDVELWDQPSLILERFPFVNPDGLLGARFCGTDGFCFPDRIFTTVHAHCLRHPQFEVRMQSPVVGIEHSSGRISAVTTPQGKVSGDVYINCTNAWATQLERLLHGDDIRTLLPVQPLRRFLWFFPEFREQLLAAHANFDPLRFPMVVLTNGVYARPEGPQANQLMMGHAHTPDPHWNFTHVDQDGSRPESDDLGEAAWFLLAEAVPIMQSRFGPTTTGFYGTTPNHQPYICADSAYGNWYRSVGFSGHGVMMSPFAADAMAALLRGEQTVQTEAGSVDLAVFGQHRVQTGVHAETAVL